MALKRWLLALDDLTGHSQPSPPEALTEEKRYGRSLRLMLSLRENARSMSEFLTPCENVLFLSGPEGGLSTQEEDDALAQGFIATTLGPRILRAETAPLAALAALTLLG
jgi:16S rRNA (uracil1498-N3)-methyltransferase